VPKIRLPPAASLCEAKRRGGAGWTEAEITPFKNFFVYSNPVSCQSSLFSSFSFILNIIKK